jgi:hypothetical protein
LTVVYVPVYNSGMIGNKVLVITVLAIVLVLSSAFTAYHEYTDFSTPPEQAAQVVHSNDYSAVIDNIYQASLAAPPQTVQSGTVSTSKRGDIVDFGTKRLINNLWGAPPEEKLSSAIILSANKTFGWYWDRPNPLMKPGNYGYQPIYPNIRTGGCPWEPSKIANFPIKISEVKSLQFDVDYNYPLAPTGTYNLAYDMFLSDTNQASSDPKPKAEVMIWLHHTLQQPSEAYQGDVSDDINTYGFYSYTMPNGRLYYAFILKEQAPLKTLQSVNARKLMDHLNLDPNWFLHGVELGNEVVNGTGNIEISKNTINLNGNEL